MNYVLCSSFLKPARLLYGSYARLLWIAALCGIALTCGYVSAAEPQEFTRLFDGKTFEGWEGDLSYFRIQDDAIVAGSLQRPIDHNVFLCTTKPFENFELRFKFKLLGGSKANAGVQIRSWRMDDNSNTPYEMIGYQADMADGYWGCLYDESRRKTVLAGPSDDAQNKIVKPDAWNDYRILCEGRRIRLWINGYPTVVYTEQDESIPQKGLIGLQIHSGPPSEAWYKDIIILEK